MVSCRSRRSSGADFADKLLYSYEQCTSKTDTNCNEFGIELDWLKAFWGSKCLNKGTARDWLDVFDNFDHNDFNSCNIFEVLDPEVFAVAPSAMLSCWNAAKVKYGIDFTTTSSCSADGLCGPP